MKEDVNDVGEGNGGCWGDEGDEGKSGIDDREGPTPWCFVWKGRGGWGTDLLTLMVLSGSEGEGSN